MKKLTVRPLFLFGVVVALSAVLLPAAPTRATIVDFDLVFDGQGNGDMSGWEYTGSNTTLSIQQSTTNPGPCQTDMTVGTIGESRFYVQKTIVNDTDFNWQGYEIAIEGENVSFGTYAYSLAFGSGEIDVASNKITFSSPEVPLAAGETTTLTFDIVVSNPEPSSLVLLGLGALMLRRRRNRAN